MKTGDLIKQRREALGMTQQELAELVGYKDRASICLIEGNKREVKQKTIIKFAQALNVRPSSLIGDIDGVDVNESLQLNKIPLLGKIACGEPILASQEQGETRIIAGTHKADFCLIARGNSMIDAKINDGDIVFCKAQNTVENGEIAALLILDGAEYAEATLKRVFFYPEQKRIILIPENTDYPPLTFTGKETEKIKIIGKAVIVQSKIV